MNIVILSSESICDLLERAEEMPCGCHKRFGARLEDCEYIGSTEIDKRSLVRTHFYKNFNGNVFFVKKFCL
jgi:hypothetical protein